MPLNTLNLAFVSAGILGLRHGFDYDHIAAISDITSMEPSKRRGVQMGFVYILGHAVTLGGLGRGRYSLPTFAAQRDRPMGGTCGRSDARFARVVCSGKLATEKGSFVSPFTRGDSDRLGAMDHVEAAEALRSRTGANAQT